MIEPEVIYLGAELWPLDAPRWAEYARVMRPVEGRPEVLDMIFTRHWLTPRIEHAPDPTPQAEPDRMLMFTVEKGWNRTGDGPWHRGNEPMLTIGPEGAIGTAQEVAQWLREVADVMDGSAD